MKNRSTGRARRVTSAGPAVSNQESSTASLEAITRMLNAPGKVLDFIRIRGFPGVPPVGLGNRGNMLLEAAVAIAIIGTVGTALLVGIQTAHSSGERTEYQASAENIGRNQIEDVFNQVYLPPPATYPSISVPSLYSVSANATVYVAGESDVEKLTVLVTFDGRNILTLETLMARP